MLGSVNGCVVRAGSRMPVAGASITVVGGPSAMPDIALLSGADGAFVLDGLAEGRWVLQATDPSGGTGEAAVQVFDNAASDATIEVNGLQRWISATLVGLDDGASDMASGQGGVAMATAPLTANPAAAGSVRGRVVRAGSGRPVPDAAISLIAGPGPAPDIAPLTDAEGWFVLDGLAPGRWLLRVLGPYGEAGEASMLVQDHASAELVIALEEPGGTGYPLPVSLVRGMVVRRASGRPVAGASISILAGPGHEAGPSIAQSDEQGRFTLEYSGTGRLALLALGRGGEMGEVQLHLPGGDADGPALPSFAIIEVDGGGQRGRLVGQLVRGDTGMPVPGAVVTLADGPVAAAPKRPPVTDEAGRFVLSGLPPGLWTLRATLPDGEVVEATARSSVGEGPAEVVLRSGRPTLALDLVNRPCRLQQAGEEIAGELVPERLNIELDPDSMRIRRLWFG